MDRNSNLGNDFLHKLLDELQCPRCGKWMAQPLDAPNDIRKYFVTCNDCFADEIRGEIDRQIIETIKLNISDQTLDK